VHVRQDAALERHRQYDGRGVRRNRSAYDHSVTGVERRQTSSSVQIGGRGRARHRSARWEIQPTRAVL